MPRDLHVEPEEPPAVTVHEDRTDQDTSALPSARPEQMRLEWGTREQGSYAGWLQVAGLDSGASEVTVHLSFFDEGHDPVRRTVDEALDGSLLAAGGTGEDAHRQRGRLRRTTRTRRSVTGEPAAPTAPAAGACSPWPPSVSRPSQAPPNASLSSPARRRSSRRP
ncbi:hypothetical protein SVIOM342S_03555 [Streptomyces violaceorubidus]